MRKLLLCSALVLSSVLPGGLVLAQDTMPGAEVCPSGDVECVSRALDNRLKFVIEKLPGGILAAPPPPPAFKADASLVSIAGPGQTDEDAFPAPGCGTKMRLTVTGQAGAIGYMQCGAVVIQCIVTRGTGCTAIGTVDAKAAGKCGIAATGAGPASALCESQN